MRQSLAALVMAGFAIAAHAYPVVSTDPNNVQVNVWNTNLDAAKAKAKALGRPTLMVVLDSVGCSFSKTWVSQIVDTPEWQTFLEANPMVLVFADKKLLSLSTLVNYALPFADGGNIYLPLIVLYRPDGTPADYFVGRRNLAQNPDFYNRVRDAIGQFSDNGAPPDPVYGTVGFSSPALEASEGAGTVTATVTRLGGSSGEQVFSYATEDGTALAGAQFTGVSGTLVWPAGDTSPRAITVPLLNDGAYTEPAERTFTLRIAKTSGSSAVGTTALTVTVNEVTPDPDATAPVFTAPTPGAGATVNAILNTELALQIQADGSGPITYSASGLPASLCIDTDTGVIAGTQTRAGSWNVSVTASNFKGSVSRAFVLRIVAQSAVAAGTYQGFFYGPDGQTVRGTLSLTAGITGALRAKAVLDRRSFSLTGRWKAGPAYEADLTETYGTGVLSLEVDDAGILTGTLGDAALLGRRADSAGAAEYAGYYTSFFSATGATPNSAEIDNRPEGSGYVTFTVSSRGAVRYAGSLADGTSFSGSTTLVTLSGAEMAELGYAGVTADQRFALFPLYAPLYSKRGVVAAQVWVDGGPTLAAGDNRVLATGTEWVYPGKSDAATADGFVATFDDGGLTEIGAAFAKPTNLATAFAGASLQTESGSVGVQPKSTSISVPAGNALQASLTASTSTGLFSGKFLYAPGGSAAPYTVSFKGALVPALGVGAGFHLAPESVGGYTVKRSKPVLIAP